ncbi:hypothetical protein BC834DRAFT_846650 [Gloeopeniophorella convolvens]|nr:hypothetical protein BC834DRAFT_846650 [Gloeopeniophorella convolvens]
MCTSTRVLYDLVWLLSSRSSASLTGQFHTGAGACNTTVLAQHRMLTSTIEERAACVPLLAENSSGKRHGSPGRGTVARIVLGILQLHDALMRANIAGRDMMPSLLGISQAPGVPISVRNILEKYNTITHLRLNGLHRLLKNLRRSSLSSKTAKEYLQDVIYHACTFYTALLERETFLGFRSGWIEALGDLAWCHCRHNPRSSAALVHPDCSCHQQHAANINSKKLPIGGDSQSPSVGIVAASLMELEPEKDHWWRIARDWFAEGVSATPGHGKSHRHFGPPNREMEGKELRGVYHFIKSMIAIRPFEMARESILPSWSPAAQAHPCLEARRERPQFLESHLGAVCRQVNGRGVAHGACAVSQRLRRWCYKSPMLDSNMPTIVTSKPGMRVSLEAQQLDRVPV